MPHKFGQLSEGFVKLCFIEFKDSIDKHVNRRVNNTNAYKYDGPPDYFA